jgi:putative ABC transport system permease protein
MSIRNSFLQLFRTPVKTTLFLVLLTLSAALLALGASLWYVSTANIDNYEATFTTIGTVQQKQTAIQIGSTWNTTLLDYQYFIYPVYGPAIPASVLSFADAGYILPPEKRPTYFSYSPDYNTGTGADSTQYQMNYLIAELQPLEDCVPSVPVKMRVGRVLYGALPESIKTLEFMDINTPEPDMLYAGKTYIMCLGNFGYYAPNGSIQGVQSDASGTRIQDELEIHTYWDEVTEGFYETPRGKRWLALVEAYNHPRYSIPVTPTRSTDLLLPFYNGEAFITEGRDISEQEYSDGDRVCLVEKRFAAQNGLTVGSTLPLPLVYADYASISRRTGSVPSYLNAKGETYQAFDSGVYTIVGIYESTAPNSYAVSYTGYEMIRNEVVIPSASVQGSDADNIILSGPMMGYNTSFQIANGDIERFMAAWDALGIEELDIQFYDKGYTQLKAGMDTMKSMAVILLVSGIATTVLNLLFFCNLLISRQKKRTAIERSLGAGIPRCALSLLSGVLALVILSAILGSLTGWILTGWAAEHTAGEETYSTRYSSWSVNTQSSDTAGDETASETHRPEAAIPLLAGCAVVWIALIIASAAAYMNLKTEPLILLSSRE